VSPRRYRSSRRRVTTEQTRARLLKAARAMLAARDAISLDAVARKAGVTRLTVYNQFGSRRALLEAVFDDMAERGGLNRIREAMTNPDPQAALQQIVVVFCDFWSTHHRALWRLHAAGATDAEFEESLRARNQRRRRLLSVLVDRMFDGDAKRPEVADELVDVLFALTSVGFFRELTAGGRRTDPARRLIQGLASGAVQRALSELTGPDEHVRIGRQRSE
jgi:AcrR family transcriptional regulator